MTAQLSGPDLALPAGKPNTLAGLLRSRLEHLDHDLIDINDSGDRRTVPASHLRARALEILSKLETCASPQASDLLVCSDNAIDLVPSAWAAILGGYSCLPWQISSFSPERELRSRMDVLSKGLNSPVLVTTERIARRLVSDRPSPFRAVIAVDSEFQGPDLKAFAERGFAGRPDAAFLIPTSGATGGPKIAVIRHETMLYRFYSGAERPSTTARIFSFPFDTVTGLWIIFHTFSDAISLRPERVLAHPLTLLELTEEFRLRSLSATSSQLARLLDALDRSQSRHDLSSLEHVGLGAETIVPHVVRAFAAELRTMGAGNARLSFGYGMTETGLICGTEKFTLDQALAQIGGDGPVSVGGCTSGLSLRVVDDDGNALSPGAEGNLEVLAEWKIFSGYRNDPELTAASFTMDGWFKTGDRGVVEDKALKITGRQKAIVIINGKNRSLEAIEAPLRAIEEIDRMLVAAGAVRSRDDGTDELAVFFVPREGANIDALSRRIRRTTAQHSGVATKYLIPVSARQFPLTRNGKVRREELVVRYQAGELRAYSFDHSIARNRASDDIKDVLASLWRTVLRLTVPPAPTDNFFELGADSLATAELITAIEARFSLRLPIEAFFEAPTIENLAALIVRRPRSPPASPDAKPPADILRALRMHTASWQGERAFPNSLVVGMNTDGRRPPIFWVLQERLEFTQLAKHFGPDQPLYGMRSCVGILPVREYTKQMVDAICNRYLWEILALRVKRPLVIAGTCQGGIIALNLARRLKQIGQRPSLLVLTEWSYSHGAYRGPTLFVYSEESYTAEIFKTGKRKIGLRRSFPNRRVVSMPGDHDHCFDDTNLPHLTEAVSKNSRSAGRASTVRVWLSQFSGVAALRQPKKRGAQKSLNAARRH